ncbi:MAG: radical SAM protein [Elusimicrobia bacterium]|nr:radical SAM protein [Elusimicrobiota bacterium]
MYILLICPPWIKNNGNIWKNITAVMPPLGMATIAACLEKEGHSVKILDTLAMKIAMDDLKDYLQTYYREEPDFIGLTGTTVTISFTYQTAQICKEIYPKTKIILGGVHASEKPHEAINHNSVDYVVRGEGEFTFLDIIQGEKLSKIKGLTYKENEKIIDNPDRELIPNLDILPIPAYHLLPIKRYYPTAGTNKKMPAISIITSRGCPGKCTFCYQPYGSLQRQRSPKKIYEEIEYLVNSFGIKEICFYDDNFTTQKPKIRELCQMLIEKGMNKRIVWSCFSRVDWADISLLKIMKQAGCHQIMYGIESGDQNILDNIKKQVTLDKIRKAIQWTKEAKIDVRATFMFGNPGETEQSMKKTIDFAIEIDPEFVVFNVASPNPGTEMYEWAVKNNMLKSQKWEEYDLTTPTLKLPTVSNEKIKEYYSLGYRRFYLRPSYMLKKLLRVRNLSDIQNILRGFKGVINVVHTNSILAPRQNVSDVALTSEAQSIT